MAPIIRSIQVISDLTKAYPNLICWTEPFPERSKITKRVNEGPGLALSAGAHTKFLLERRIWVCPVAVSWQDVTAARKLKCSYLVMAYSKLFNNVFEALNKFFYNFLSLCIRNAATWQCHSTPLHNTEFWLEFCHGWPSVTSITSCKV